MGEMRQRDSGVVVEVLVCVGCFLILGLSDLADVWSGDRVAKCLCLPADALCTGPQAAAAIASARRKAWPLLLALQRNIPHFHSLWFVSMTATDLMKLRKNWWWLAGGARRRAATKPCQEPCGGCVAGSSRHGTRQAPDGGRSCLQVC